MADKPDSPKGTQIRQLRETYGLSQTQAADLVYSTLRSWQNWEGDEVGMHPAIWAWFRHRVESGEAPPSPRATPVKYVRRVIQFWWNERDQSVHVTTDGTEPPLHTTFPSSNTSDRWHRSMFDWLRKTLEANEKPTPKPRAGFQTKVSN
jgi:putative transcriptional regulator